jgi:hypothetical protein
LTELLKDKNTSLARLRKLLFGSQTEKTNAVVGGGKDSQSPPPQAVAASAPEMEPVSSTDAEKSPPKGHGRNGADAYTGAEKVVVRYESLQPGDPCPKCEEGTVYETGRPGVLVRLVRVAGAPLDNNICERALKKAILHRKNALFYKTGHGAHVGDVFMSLIHTCELCGANAFDYLTELERHAGELSSNPQDWMPWNYRKKLKSKGT